jgi:ParB family transcriptional regulator, chromosome partitioning protein
MEKKPRLGRGLDALLGGSGEDGNGPSADLSQVSVQVIDQNPYQPRRAFDEEELSSLGESIRTHGILQPLVVRAVGDRFQLVAGERRLRAARAVGLDAVPVRVVNFNDQQVLEAALVENIQRSDLNPIEKAQGFKDYLSRFRMTHEELAKRLGLARVTITNLLGLLDLPPEVQDEVRRGQITTGHAKLLKGLADRDRQLAVCKEIIARGLSVHATEAFLKQQNQEKAEKASAAKEVVEKTAHVEGIENELRQKLATRVEIRLSAKDKGQVVLRFESNDDFERILEVLRR